MNSKSHQNQDFKTAEQHPWGAYTSSKHTKPAIGLFAIDRAQLAQLSKGSAKTC